MIPVCPECGREHLPNCREQRHRDNKGSFYYPLFEHMSHEHGLTLLDSEMDEIFEICKKLLLGGN